ncbi:MAG: hypothetical protein R6X02_14820 [Enhygromyxa sp.]
MLVTYARPSQFVSLALSLAGLSFMSFMSFMGAGGCADPCVDDGLVQKACPSAQEAGNGTAETGADGHEAEAGTNDGSEAESGDDMSSGDGDGDSTGDGDGESTGDGDGESTGDGDGDELPPSCFNGVQDGDETDVDCGGSCGDTCLDGDLCMVDGDCITGLCNTGVCKDPVCNPDESNSCQGCLQQQCCDNMIACFEDPGCVCWFECISHNNDFGPCQDACNIGNIGPITSCANSKCGDVDACGV